MQTTTKFILLFLFTLVLQNCDQDDVTSSNGNNPGSDSNDIAFQAENFGNITTGSFIGVVTNRFGENLSDVQITLGNTMTMTDRNGVFVLNNAEVYENFAYIKAFKEGYINGSRVVIPKSDGVNRINIVLLNKDVTATVNSGENSSVTAPNGTVVGFSGDFINSDGTPYNGQVEVVLHEVRPNLQSTFTQMPGSLFAQSATNDAVNLETYGMVSVNLFSPSGEPLNIDENIPATLELPISFSQQDIAPDVIPLWYFDETVGYWKEEGQAVKSNNKYFGLVSHFSWWNCDIPFDAVNLCFSLTSGTTAASTPYRVNIKRNSNNQVIYDGTVLSQDGFECGLIPRNEVVTVSVYSQGPECNFSLIHEEVLGGYSSDTDVNISFSEEFLTTTITGTVTNCSGNPLTNGYVYVDQFNIYSITNGIINIGLQHCDSSATTIEVFDYDTGQWAFVNDVALNGETINLEALSTCEDTGGTYNGDITLSTQAEVNDFGLFNFTRVAGSLEIGDSNGSDITDLTPLQSLVTIDEILTITKNTNLQTLEGLNNIETIDIIFISYNSSLVSTSTLESLTSVNALLINNNGSLETIGLNSLTNTGGDIYIENNDNLVALDGLNNVTSVNILSIENNDQLNAITGLNNLTTLNVLSIKRNNALANLMGLESITELNFLWVLSNPIISSLNGLENVTQMTPSTVFANIMIGFGIDFDTFENLPNPNLTDFCALENLFVNGNGASLLEDTNDVLIANNGYNPTIQDLIDGNCSL